jgi:hypothetical protein
MITRGFMEIEDNKNDPWWANKPISCLTSHLQPIEKNMIDSNLTISSAIALMKSNSVDSLIYFNENK